MIPRLQKPAWPPSRVLVPLVLGSAVLLLPGDSSPLIVLRFFVGFAFVIWLPGTLTAAWLLDRPSAAGPTGQLFAVALSFLIVSALGYLLVGSPWGLSSWTITFALALWSAVAFVGGMMRPPRKPVRIQADDRAWLRRLDRAAPLVLLVVGSVAVRLLPLANFQAFLDLDPYNHWMKVEAILVSGHLPPIDTLSVAPNGTSATYAITPLGFEFAIISIHSVSRVPLVDAMRLLPVASGALLAVATYVFTRWLTGSPSVAWLGASFVAFPISWLLVYQVAGNPIAENIGILLFMISLIQLTLFFEEPSRKSAVQLAIVVSSMTYAHLFSVFYFVIVAVVYLSVRAVTRQLPRWFANSLSFSVGMYILLSLPVLAFVLPSSSAVGSYFSESAFLLAFAEGSYLIVTLQNLPLVFVLVYLPFGLAGLFWMHINRKGIQDALLLTSSYISLMILLLISAFEPLRAPLAGLPFAAPILYQHRILPYVTLASAPLIALSLHRLVRLVGTLSRPKGFRNPLSSRIRSIFPRAVAIGLAIIFVGANGYASVASTRDLGLSPTADRYSRLLSWMDRNTSVDDVFLLNNWDLSLWTRAVAGRPTVFSHVHQDLASVDVVDRMLLHAYVFTPETFECVSAVELLSKFNVAFIVVAAQPAYADIVADRWIFSMSNVSAYIDWMDSNRFVQRVYSEPNEAWVYRVYRLQLPAACIGAATILK